MASLDWLVIMIALIFREGATGPNAATSSEQMAAAIKHRVWKLTYTDLMVNSFCVLLALIL